MIVFETKVMCVFFFYKSSPCDGLCYEMCGVLYGKSVGLRLVGCWYVSTCGKGVAPKTIPCSTDEIYAQPIT